MPSHRWNRSSNPWNRPFWGVLGPKSIMYIEFWQLSVILIALRGVCVHTFYVDVMTTSTMYLGTISAVSLHGVVWSTTTSWDTGTIVILLVASSCFSWVKENHQDEYRGVNTMTSSISLLASMVLVVISEAMLFISILWSVVLSLVAHSIYSSNSLLNYL